MCPAPKYSPEEQESLILKAAGQVIEQSSLLDFTMSAIAKKAGISMGSIYKHVQTKEDVLIALEVLVLKQRLEAFKQVMAWTITTPEKLIAVSLFDYQKINLYPFDNQLDMLISNDAILSRGSATWIDRMTRAGTAISNYFLNILKQAVESCELSVEGEVMEDVNQLDIGLWALSIGNVHVALSNNGGILPLFQINSPQIRNTQRFINSFSWQKTLDDDGIEKVCILLKEAGLR